MKKFSYNLTNNIEAIGLKKIALVALALRVLLAIPFRSGDLDNYAIWGIYSRQFGFSGFYDFLNFGNYARPDYPPLAMVLFWCVRAVWEAMFLVLWKVNISIPAFPSNVIPWFENEGYLLLLKIPGLASDFLIGLVLVQYVSKKFNRKKGLLAGFLYWFNPATIYVSSMWGQVDGLVILLGLLSVIFAEEKKVVVALLSFTASILIKPTMLMVFPIILYLLITKKAVLGTLVKGLFVSGLFASVVAFLFAPWNPVVWLIKNYLFKFLKGAVTLPYIQLRAYNLWTLLTGWEFTVDTIQFSGISLFHWAFVIFIPVMIYLFVMLARSKNYWGIATLLIFASYLFLPRVHERYLLPAIPFFIVYLSKNPSITKMYLAISALYFLNLYGAWKVPASFLADILQVDLLTRAFSFGLIVFFYLLVKQQSQVSSSPK